MSNSHQRSRLSKHEIIHAFSGLEDKLKEIIKSQEERLKELNAHSKEIKQFIGEKYPSNPLKQERESTGWLRYAVWQEYFPLKAQVKENKELLSRMKQHNNFSPDSDRIEVSQVKDVPITHYIDFNSAGKAQCIWHSDNNPSLHYYEDDNRVHCFSCGAGGDVIDVVQELHSCTFKQALTELSH